MSYEHHTHNKATTNYEASNHDSAYWIWQAV
jgi:hypothetical protein